jgi:hypothetical protein
MKAPISAGTGWRTKPPFRKEFVLSKMMARLVQFAEPAGRQAAAAA